MLTDKQRREMMKVSNGEKFAKDWNFWASLSRQGMVIIRSKTPPQCGVSSIEITNWGRVNLEERR